MTAADNAAADLECESGAGVVAPLGDVGEIKRALGEIAEHGPPSPCNDGRRSTNETMSSSIGEANERAQRRSC